MTFEPNVGQADNRVQFLGRGKGMTVILTRREIAMRVSPGTTHQAPSPHAVSAEANSASTGTLTLSINGNSTFDWHGESRLRGESNYFIGNDPRSWHTRVAHFERAESSNVSRGIGISVYGSQDGIEYDLRVAPGADVSQLRLKLAGAEHLRLNSAGDLSMTVGGAELMMMKPVVYEQSRPRSNSKWHSSRSAHPRAHKPRGATRARKYNPRQNHRTPGAGVRSKAGRPKRAADPCAPKLPRLGQSPSPPADAPCPKKSAAQPGLGLRAHRRLIEASYIIAADGSIGFRVGPHDPGATLVIDPSLSVVYASFLGGSGADAATSIAVDSTGKVYVGGITSSTSFSSSANGRLGPADGPAQFFIAKIDPSMTGASSLIYLTFLGGSGTQAGGLIALTSSGSVAITGTTTATDFPVTDTTVPTSALASGNGNDTIVSEIGPAGNALFFSTLFGGSGAESQSGAGGIALDSSGDVYISSDVKTTPLDSASADLPVTTGAFQTTWDGQTGDGFLAIFTPPAASGGAATLKYCSYLGTYSSGEPGVGGMAVDASGNAYIAGFTSNGSNPFPAMNAFQTAYGGGLSDAFIMKISPQGAVAADLVYASLLGGSGADQALAVALDSSNPPDAYVTGTTSSPNFPTNGVVAAYQTALHPNATANAFLTVVSQNGVSGQSALAYSTYFGGSNSDAGLGLAVEAPNLVYLTGSTTSHDLPWHNNLQAFNGAGDAFVARFDPSSPGAASLVYVTPLGGTSPAGGVASAAGKAIAADQNGHVYVAGLTTSIDFPTAVTTQAALNGFQPACSSCQVTPPVSDGFVAEIAESSTPMPSVYFNVAKVPFLPSAIGTSSVPQPVAVLNGGDASLSISNIEVSGANAADFSLIGGSVCFAQAINPGPAAMCSFEVGFTPSTTGAEIAVVAVYDNAPGSPQVLELVASGQGPLAAVSPSGVNFGSQPENSTSPSHTITVTNAGSQPLVVSVVEQGPDSGQFTILASAQPESGLPICMSPISLPAASSCVLNITFEPNAVRTFNADVELTDNSGGIANSQQIVSLTGAGVASAPVVTFSTSLLAFAANQVVGTTSAPENVTLTNAGSTALSITGITLAGANASDFLLASAGTTCPVASGTVAVQGSCTVAVQLAPKTAGSKNASLDFVDNAAGSPQQIALSGTAQAAPSLVVSPASLSFPAQSEGIASAPQNVSIANNGAAPTDVTGVSISGPDAADFSAPASCVPNPVPIGASCQIAVNFTPTAAGIRTATLTVPQGTPGTVALSGTATQPGISVPASVNFGSQFAGGSGGSPQPIVITNSSSGSFAGALTITSVSKTGADPGDFAISSDSCIAASTLPGSTCTLQVAFKPLQTTTCGANAGTRTASLALSDNAPGSPQSVPLSGTATDFCINVPAGQPIVQPITAGQSATYTLEIDSSQGLTGSAALTCSVPAALLGTCTVTTTPATTPPTVQIVPGTPGQFQVLVTTTAQPAVSLFVRRWQPPRPASQRANRLRWIVVLCLAILAARLLRRRRPTLARLAQAAALLLVFATAMAACGGGSSSAPSDPPPGTPPGAYTITLTATATVTGQPSVTRTLSLPLTVIPPAAD